MEKASFETLSANYILNSFLLMDIQSLLFLLRMFKKATLLYDIAI